MSKKTTDALTRVVLAARAVIREKGELRKNTASNGHLAPLLMAIEGLEHNLLDWAVSDLDEIRDEYLRHMRPLPPELPNNPYASYAALDKTGVVEDQMDENPVQCIGGDPVYPADRMAKFPHTTEEERAAEKMQFIGEYDALFWVKQGTTLKDIQEWYKQHPDGVDHSMSHGDEGDATT